MDSKKELGQRINAALAMRDKKQKELAHAIGVTDNTISYFCSGKRVPNLQQIIAISKELNVSTDYLLGLSAPDNVTTDEKLGLVSEYTGLGNVAVEKLREMKSMEDSRAWTNLLSCLISDSDFEYFLGLLEGYFAEEETVCVNLAMSAATISPKDISIFAASNSLRDILERIGEQFSHQGYLTTHERLRIYVEKIRGGANYNGQH